MPGTEPRNLLKPMLLLLVLERPDHGYDLLARLSDLGVDDVEAGHLYRVLNSLERDGFVESAWVTLGPGPARRRYDLTAKGVAELDAWAERMLQLEKCVDVWLERWNRLTGAPQGVRDRSVRAVAGGEG